MKLLPLRSLQTCMTMFKVNLKIIQKLGSYLKNNVTVHFLNKLSTHLSICQILRMWSFDTI